MANVLAKNPFQVGFAHWNQEVEALAPDGSDEPFAIRVRFGRPDGRFQDAHPEPLQFGVEVAREDRIAVVDDESIAMIVRQKLAELLDRPLGSRVLGDVAVQNPPRADFHRNEYVQDAERRSHGHEKVASDDGLCMIPYKGCPTLAGASAWITQLQILAAGSRRDSNAQFQ